MTLPDQGETETPKPVTIRQLQAAWHAEVLQRAVEETVKLVNSVGRMHELSIWQLTPYRYAVMQRVLQQIEQQGLVLVERDHLDTAWYVAKPAEQPQPCGQCSETGLPHNLHCPVLRGGQS